MSKIMTLSGMVVLAINTVFGEPICSMLGANADQILDDPLPYDAEVEWVQFNKNIDTNVSGIIPIELETSISVSYRKANSSVIGIAGWVGSYPRFHLLYVDTSTYLSVGRGTQYYPSDIRLTSDMMNKMFSIHSFFGTQETSLLIDGHVGLQNRNVQVPTTSGTIKIFSSNHDFRIYNLLIKSNEIILFDAIPVRKRRVGALFDRVSGCLFGLEEGGAIAYGPDL